MADNNNSSSKAPIAHRFRGFLPVVVDVETGGFNANTDALLEIAAVILDLDEGGEIFRRETIQCHVKPFKGANLEAASLAITGIDPFHPLRIAYDEKDALERIFSPIRKAVKNTGCSRAILVGHNPFFDLGFIKSAVDRTGIKRNPFHAFSTFDTATLSALAFGQTVLSRAAQAAGISWDNSEAHSARYDAERTADLFCAIVNRWDNMKSVFGDIKLADNS